MLKLLQGSKCSLTALIFAHVNHSSSIGCITIAERSLAITTVCILARGFQGAWQRLNMCSHICQHEHSKTEKTKKKTATEAALDRDLPSWMSEMSPAMLPQLELRRTRFRTSRVSASTPGQSSEASKSAACMNSHLLHPGHTGCCKTSYAVHLDHGMGCRPRPRLRTPSDDVATLLLSSACPVQNTAAHAYTSYTENELLAPQ